MAVTHKGSISMGLVLIPIGMYKATVDNDIHFEQLEKGTSLNDLGCTLFYLIYLFNFALCFSNN